jgi:hypothetical protein
MKHASMTLPIKQIKDAGSVAYFVRERPRTQDAQIVRRHSGQR